MKDGDFAGANEALLATFPPATRTAAQSFMLGNVLFELDRKRSYALHEAAAAAEPNNEAVVWEWALEQHRAGEYAAALASYQAYSKTRPSWAASYALQADCLLRRDRIDEAVDAWRKSERAREGSVETMEDLVCAVHRDPAPHQCRAALLAKVTQHHDVEAAADLIALDCDFPKDWWDAGPHETYLAHDAPVVAAALVLPANDVRGRAIACAAECATADGDDTEVKTILAKHRLLVDPDRTIPAHGGLLSVILIAAVEAKAIDDTTLRRHIGPKVLELSRSAKVF